MDPEIFVDLGARTLYRTYDIGQAVLASDVKAGDAVTVGPGGFDKVSELLPPVGTVYFAKTAAEAGTPVTLCIGAEIWGAHGVLPGVPITLEADGTFAQLDGLGLPVGVGLTPTSYHVFGLLPAAAPAG